MRDVTDLRNSTGWNVAVWGLRVIGPGLGVVVAGLVALAWATTTGQALLAVGMAVYLVGVVVTIVGIAAVYRTASPVRPNFIQLRWALLSDAVHVRSASADDWIEGLGHPDDRSGEPTRMEGIRRSAHWRPAVWGVRMMVPALAVVVVSLVALVGSASTGTTILAVGVGIYIVAVVFTFVEVRRAYGDLQPPRPAYANVQRALVHDALRSRS